MILAGDVGGTKTNVALFGGSGDRLTLIRRASYRSREHDGLRPILDEFLGGTGADVRGACIGIAGPVVDNRCRTSNLPWEVDGDETAERAGLPFLVLVNDLIATAEGIPSLGPENVAVLNEGRSDPRAAAVLIAAGTGLGMCIIPPGDGSGGALPSEGGHSSFSARNEDEIALRKTLESRFGTVSVERVVSGRGLLNVYEHLAEHPPPAASPEVRRRMENEDPGAVISRAAATGECPVCVKAHDMFVSAYGAIAGDLALIALARGGVWIGGGIAPRILGLLSDGTFMDAFLSKGRFRHLMKEIPVRVILDPEAAVLGAARVAARTASVS